MASPEEIAELKTYLDTSPPGSQEYVTVKQEYDRLTAPQTAPTGGPQTTAPQQPPTVLPGPRVDTDPRLLQPRVPNINYNAPIEDVRTALAAVENKPMRQAGLDRWADFEEQRQNQVGGISGMARTANDWMRGIARGVPGGAWGDEANAAISSVLPNALGGMPYEEKLALERARNRRMDYQHPVGSAVANIGGAVASAPAVTLRGAGILGNTLVDTAIGGIQGAGNSEGNLTDRGRAGATDAAITAPMSLGLNSVLHGLTRYGQLSPEIITAARVLGVERLIPAFAKSASLGVQAEGRRAAQGSLDSSLNNAWRTSLDATEQAASNAANRAAGSTDVQMAPHTAGTAINPQLQGAIDAAQTQKGALSRQNENLLPPGVRYDVPEMRGTTNRMVGERAGFGAERPEAGLGDQLNMATRPPPDPINGPFYHYGPGGSSWPEIADQATEIGQRLGLPASVPRDVDDARLSQIYAALRNDQRSIMRQDAGPWGEATFNQNVAQQSALSQIQRDIEKTMGEKPEDIVNLAHRAASVRGAGTDVDALQVITQALPPQARQQLGGGVLGKIINDANGSPQKMATALDSMSDSTRAMLFPPGTQLAADVEALRTVTTRLGEVNALQGTGSAASLGEKMAIAGKYGGIGLGGAAALYGANQAGYGNEAAAIGTGLLGARYGFNRFAKPYLLEHGVGPGLQTGIDAARGLPRGLGQQYQLPPVTVEP